MVPALSAVRAVVIALINVSETGGFEFGVIHRHTVPASACAYPRDNSYSSRRPPILYGQERYARIRPRATSNATTINTVMECSIEFL